MTDALSITLSSAISKHIKVLKKAGLISRSTLAQLRPCQLEPVPLKEVITLINTFRQLPEEYFDSLENDPQELQSNSITSSNLKSTNF